jgi:putative colanic acid biosynthesis acetyltransferase WcaF
VSARRLGAFSGHGYDKGRPFVMQALWFAVLNLIFVKWWCPAVWRVSILRWFGADIGKGVLIRHRVRILWPWKLVIGEDSWIGEGVWLLNLEPIVIGRDTCLSQEAFICTGSHSFKSPSFEYDNAPITIGNYVWIGARATVLRGVQVEDECIVPACFRLSRNLSKEEQPSEKGSERPT